MVIRERKKKEWIKREKSGVGEQLSGVESVPSLRSIRDNG